MTRRKKRIKFIAVYHTNYMLVWDDGSYHRFEELVPHFGGVETNVAMTKPEYWIGNGWSRVIEL